MLAVGWTKGLAWRWEHMCRHAPDPGQARPHSTKKDNACTFCGWLSRYLLPVLRRCSCRVFALIYGRYGVLSTYVQDFGNLGLNVGGHWEVAHLCEVFFTNSKQPRNQQARVRAVYERDVVPLVAAFLELF